MIKRQNYMHAGIKRAYKQYRAYKDIDSDGLS